MTDERSVKSGGEREDSVLAESSARALSIAANAEQVASAAAQRLTMDDSPDDFVVWLEKHQP